jgi:hypothetical protein
MIVVAHGNIAEWLEYPIRFQIFDKMQCYVLLLGKCDRTSVFAISNKQCSNEFQNVALAASWTMPYFARRQVLCPLLPMWRK